MLFGIDLTSPEAWISLVTLVALEVVLGVDNLVVIAIISGKLPPDQARTARRIGLAMAAIIRLALLPAIAWVLSLREPAVTVLGHVFSWKDLVLLGGGLFLIAKATLEIHERVTAAHLLGHGGPAAGGATRFALAILQILLLNLVFSLDSIIVGIGLTPNVGIIAVAVVLSVIAMLVLVEWVSGFVMANPTVIMLALSFLVMIGMVLVADGFGVHVPKEFVYVAMAFSAMVEALNMLARRAAMAVGTAGGRRGGPGH
jgi:predicted tellurium resistance membrane protein TerC